ncbi:hypothetical protein J6590_084224 [Homalodisca vitripennis]|nr:hypothetical protein J6590_084224 [Homalodisca vitripennis]
MVRERFVSELRLAKDFGRISAHHVKRFLPEILVSYPYRIIANLEQLRHGKQSLPSAKFEYDSSCQHDVIVEENVAAIENSPVSTAGLLWDEAHNTRRLSPAWLGALRYFSYYSVLAAILYQADISNMFPIPPLAYSRETVGSGACDRFSGGTVRQQMFMKLYVINGFTMRVNFVLSDLVTGSLEVNERRRL